MMLRHLSWNYGCSRTGRKKWWRGGLHSLAADRNRSIPGRPPSLARLAPTLRCAFPHRPEASPQTPTSRPRSWTSRIPRSQQPRNANGKPWFTERAEDPTGRAMTPTYHYTAYLSYPPRRGFVRQWRLMIRLKGHDELMDVVWLTHRYMVRPCCLPVSVEDRGWGVVACAKWCTQRRQR
jgi:hypothetical protein